MFSFFPTKAGACLGTQTVAVKQQPRSDWSNRQTLPGADKSAMACDGNYRAPKLAQHHQQTSETPWPEESLKGTALWVAGTDPAVART